ncbi:hypothetical protein A0H81_03170 [Grifola frondosa]|uniref:DUF8212 domain-containing protein n=1 Tax=Grifola frondosa TaxID=5627 RepID=A0A1C7MJG1_GRIFR|nr:hypothetical protein A0H81_03170 [Grifola frondosa]
MFSWYRKSEVCYAYLDDVPGIDLPESKESDFRKSEWFTRGWTLQELIAPSSVIFFSKSWVEIGTKTSLASVIENITKVNRKVLSSTFGEEVSVAQRMSWAAGRKTTREEDRAYSLMGLFGVNMPTIYGEGKRAFIRLQHEIMKTSNDCSLFVWQSSSLQNSGLLAPSPDEFAGSAWVSRTPHDAFVRQWRIRNPRPHYELTNYGHVYCISTMRYNRTALDNVLHYANSDIPTTGVEVQDVYVKEIDPSLFNIIDYAYISPSASYVFKLTITIPEGYCVAGFAVNRTSYWKTNSPTEYLYTHSCSGGCGLILLRNDRTGHWVAVALGAHNWRIWSDIVDGRGEVTADGILDVVYNFAKGSRGQVDRQESQNWDRDQGIRRKVQALLSILPCSLAQQLPRQ